MPVGFNAVAYKVTANSLSGQTSGTAAAADILAGKTAWVGGSQITGTMADKSGDQTASGKGSYTSNSTNYLYLTIPATGKYTSGSKLKSDIVYRSQGAVELPVTITVNATGETIATSSSKTFPAGYYSGEFNIKAVYDSTSTSTNKVINIDNAVGQLNAQSGTLAISDGYDYFAADASYSVKTGSVSAVTRSVNSSTGVVSFSGGTTTAGWISSNVTIPATYTPTAAVFSTDATTGKVTVTTAGWVPTSKDITGLQAGSATMSGPTQNTGSSAITVGSTSVSAGNYYMKLVKTAGYITAATSAIVLGATSLSTAALTASGTNATTITSKYFKVTASAGYNASTLTKNLTVQNAAYSTSSSTGKITVTTAGWIAANTVLGWGNATAQSYTMDGDDITASTFVVACATNTPMTQLTVNTDVILNRLKAI